MGKYQLVEWSGEEFDCSEDDSIRQVTTLVEEFLNVVILVLGERHTPGVGQVSQLESIRKEVVQLLCVENICHSKLLTSVISYDAANRENNLEKVVQTVAVFKKPAAGAGRATYELKPEFFDEYNVFYYHYNKEEQSKSEQNMRKRRKDAGHPECNPPPVAPPFAKGFAKILGLIESDVFLHCVSLVLRRADDLKARCFSENQVHCALHLIGHCLNEEERAREGSSEQVRFTERAEEPQFQMLQLLERLRGSQRIESHKELLEWVLRKYRRLAGKSEEAAGGSASSAEASEKRVDEAAESERKAKQELAAARRKAMMEKMKKAQSKVIQL